MHFCINLFIFLICGATLVLFTEVFPKLLKIILTVIGSYCLSYAAVILVRKIADWSGWYARPVLFPYVYYTFGVVLVLSIIGFFTLQKKQKA